VRAPRLAGPRRGVRPANSPEEWCFDRESGPEICVQKQPKKKAGKMVWWIERRGKLAEQGRASPGELVRVKKEIPIRFKNTAKKRKGSCGWGRP